MSVGWTIGYIVGGVVVLIVVLLLGILIFSARKIAEQAGEIELALELAKDRTEPLWALDDVNARIRSITGRLETARKILGGEK